MDTGPQLIAEQDARCLLIHWAPLTPLTLQSVGWSDRAALLRVCEPGLPEAGSHCHSRCHDAYTGESRKPNGSALSNAAKATKTLRLGSKCPHRSPSMRPLRFRRDLEIYGPPHQTWNGERITSTDKYGYYHFVQRVDKGKGCAHSDRRRHERKHHCAPGIKT